MSTRDFDLAIVGAGSGGLTAARFAAQLGARVALIEKHRVGGDCTWNGCVPSKALLKVAKVAHEVRSAARFGLSAAAPAADMSKVREYIRNAIGQVYELERPEVLREEGIEVIEAAARFIDANTLSVGAESIQPKAVLITTGAHPHIPAIAGLSGVAYRTYEQIFELDQLPGNTLIAGGGPVAMEIAQALQRLGSQVTVVAETLLPRDEPEVRDVMQRVFRQEGVRFMEGLAISARQDGNAIVVATKNGEARGDLLMLATGRRPNVADLGLENAGVTYSTAGIPVDDHLRTNVKHIYAAGDVVGGYQFTHFAAWQAFHAARNALLPGGNSGASELVPWVTFTDPEVAHVGLTEERARAKFGDDVAVVLQDLSHNDRAVCEDDRDGFTKVITRKNGTVLGATLVSARAGEAITEFVVALQYRLKVADLAATIHAYPTYSTAVQQIAAEMAVESSLSGKSGTIARALSKFVR